MGTEIGGRIHDDVHNKVRLISISDSRFTRQRERQYLTRYNEEQQLQIPRRILARHSLCTNLKKRISKTEFTLSKSLTESKLDRYKSVCFGLNSPWKTRSGTQWEHLYGKSKSAPLKKNGKLSEPILRTADSRPNTIGNSQNYTTDTPSYQREATLSESVSPPRLHRETTIADSVALPTLRPDTRMVTLRQLSEILNQSDKTDKDHIKVNINHIPNGYPNITVNLNNDVRIARKPHWFEDSKSMEKPGNDNDDVSSIHSSILEEQLNKERHEKFLVKTELNTASCFVHPLNKKYLKELDRKQMATRTRVEHWMANNPVGEQANNNEIAEDGWLEITTEEQKYHNESQWIYQIEETPDYFEKFRKELKLERNETASERSAKNRAAERKKLLYYMRLKRKQRMGKPNETDDKSETSKTPAKNKNAKIVNKTDIK
ncbi:unnamed protein product [Owenia fusiformis]|uniref:Uncharacterized protein n=1 Tax=Owenia fusiformis TaxID=6347 RepID=A0A8J1T750_OWEFU|nr:unnamed protein product [Owenia fusiformis]